MFFLVIFNLDLEVKLNKYVELVRMASNAARPTSVNITCRSNNPAKLINYQVGKNEKPVLVSLLFHNECNNTLARDAS